MDINCSKGHSNESKTGEMAGGEDILSKVKHRNKVTKKATEFPSLEIPWICLKEARNNLTSL